MWNNNNVQFARFIAEAEMAGAFTPEVVRAMCESTDLDIDELTSLNDRAQTVFDLEKIALAQDMDTYEGVLLERFATNTAAQDLARASLKEKAWADTIYILACVQISLDPASETVRKVWPKFVEGLSGGKTA